MASIRQALGRFEENEFSNISRRAQRRTAKIGYQDSSADRLLKLASNFNTKLGEELVARDERIKEEKTREMRVLADENWMEQMESTGTSPVTPEAQETYNQGVQELEENKTKSTEAARQVLTTTGNYDRAQKIKDLAGHDLYEYTKRTSELAAANVQEWMQGEMIKNDQLEFVYEGETLTPKTAKTLQQKAAALKELRKEYIRINGLDGVSTEIKAEEGGLFDKSISAKAALMKQYTTQDAIRRSFEDKEKATDFFRDANHAAKDHSSFNDLHQALRLTVDDTGKPLSEEDALSETIKIIESQMDVGEFRRTDYEALGEQMVKDPTTGDMKPLKEVWPTRYKELGESLDEAEAENEKAAQAKEKAAFQKDERAILDQVKDLEDKDILPFLTKEQAKLYKKHPGRESTKIDKFILNFAKGDAYLIQKGEAFEKMRNGTLTLEELKKFDVRLQNDETLQKFATALTNAQAGGPVEEYIKEINDAIAFKINKGGIDKKNPTVKPMERYTKTKFNAFLATAIANDVPKPADFARQATLAWLDSYAVPGKNFSEDGYINVPGTLSRKELKKILKANNAEKERQLEVLTKYDKTILTQEHIGKLIGKEELITSLGDYLKTSANPTSFDYPGEIDTLYKHIGDGKQSKFDIMNHVLQLHGLPTLGNKPPSIEKFDNNASKADNVTLWNKTPNTSSRVWGLIASKEGVPNLELFPNGLGEEVFKWSEENNFDYGDLAASTEFFTANPSIAISYGLTEDDLGAFKMPPSTSGSVDWNRVGMAAGKLKLHVMTRTQALGQEVVQTTKNMMDFFGDSYNWLGENTVEFADTINQIVESGVSNAMDADVGNILQESLVEPVTQTPQILEDEVSNTINNVVNQILGDAPELTDEEIRDYQISKYKQTGDINQLPIRQ